MCTFNGTGHWGESKNVRLCELKTVSSYDLKISAASIMPPIPMRKFEQKEARCQRDRGEGVGVTSESQNKYAKRMHK